MTFKSEAEGLCVLHFLYMNKIKKPWCIYPSSKQFQEIWSALDLKESFEHKNGANKV